MRPLVLIFTFLLPFCFSSYLPIDESNQGNKARVAYALAKEVSKNFSKNCKKKKNDSFMDYDPFLNCEAFLDFEFETIFWIWINFLNLNLSLNLDPKNEPNSKEWIKIKMKILNHGSKSTKRIKIQEMDHSYSVVSNKRDVTAIFWRSIFHIPRSYSGRHAN